VYLGTGETRHYKYKNLNTKRPAAKLSDYSGPIRVDSQFSTDKNMNILIIFEKFYIQMLINFTFFVHNNPTLDIIDNLSQNLNKTLNPAYLKTDQHRKCAAI